MKRVALLLLGGMAISARAMTPNFEVFCRQLLQKKPGLSDYSASFTKDFQKAVPLDHLTAIFKEVYDDVGACVSFKYTSVAPSKFDLTLTGDKKMDATFSVTFDEAQGLFSGLLLGGIQDPSVQIKSWNDVESALSKLDSSGKLSATLTTTDGALELLHHSSEVFAVGSTFKLYVLGALEQAITQGLHQWDEVLPIRDEWKSLPSGDMHTWPAGQEVKLYEYAEKMISRSDNTATDHLLYLLGRESIERMLSPMGNFHEHSYLPLLGTLEMFKLKWGVHPAVTQDYILKNKADRLVGLDALKRVPRAQVGTNGVELDKPTLIDKLEWFATTQENCRAMFWLASQNSPQIRSILSKSVPVLTNVGSPRSHWAFAGYKGGSEPGVLSMTFLLEGKGGQRACLAMSWNNTTKNISQNRLMDIVKKTLGFAETQVP